MRFIIPDYVLKTMDKLNINGFEAFIVGGSLRDLLLKKEPSDYDITTNAKPEEIIQVFDGYKTILVGLEFGTVAVVMDGKNIEITTYRIEEEYLDGRKPSAVSFTNKLEEDLSRRDFTINAMAYNKDRGIVDYFHGKDDLKKGIIRTVGDPRERFKEDHLRILRAIRFASQLNFTIEEETYHACKELVHSLKSISPDRIRDEVFKILLSPQPSYGLKLMADLGVLEAIIPDLAPTIGFDQRTPYHYNTLFEHIVCVVDKTPPILSLRLAALFHDIGKPDTFTIDEEDKAHFYGHDRLGAQMTEEILKGLHCSNDLINRVRILVKEHMNSHNEYGEKGLKRLISNLGEEEVFHLIHLQKADRLCSHPGARIDDLLEREIRIQEILNFEEAYEKKQLDISGYDIISLGYKEGKIVGLIIDYLMDQVLEKPELNKKENLIEIVKEGAGIWESYLEQME